MKVWYHIMWDEDDEDDDSEEYSEEELNKFRNL